MREHLRRCPTCTAELLELGAAREALLTAVPRAAAPPELKSRVMTQVRADAELFAAARERETGRRAGAGARRAPGAGARRFGWLRAPVPLAAAAACAVVLAVGAGVLGAALVGGDDGGSPSTRTVSAQVDAAQAPGAQRPARRQRRRRLAAASSTACPPRGAAASTRCGCAAATGPRARRARCSPSTATGNGEAAVPGTLDGVDQVLVSSEPAGGSQQPTRTPVLAARVQRRDPAGLHLVHGQQKISARID